MKTIKTSATLAFLAILINFLFSYGCKKDDPMPGESPVSDHQPIPNGFTDADLLWTEEDKAIINKYLDIPTDYYYIYDLDLPEYPVLSNTNDVKINARYATIGRALFYDTILSIDGSKSCASCHS